MSTATFTRTGNKATKTTTLPKEVFGLEVKNHQLLEQAYKSYLARGRSHGAHAKTRGLVRGGGAKPWRQKGTGRARAGSIRSPLWRSGGVTFGPSADQRRITKLSSEQRRLAIKQALSLAQEANKLKVIETFDAPEGKVKKTVELLEKLEVQRRVLIVVSQKDELVERATRNIPEVKAVDARYLNVFDILNADHIVISQKAVALIKEWLGA